MHITQLHKETRSHTLTHVLADFRAQADLTEKIDVTP